MNHTYFLIIITLLGFLARSRVLVLAGFTLLIVNEFKFTKIIEFFSNKGIDIGLTFLLLAILSPLIINTLEWEDIKNTFLVWRGLVAILAGLLATRFNGMGLELLSISPQLIVGIIIGSLIGISLFGGIPVGPLMAAGIAAILIKAIELFS